MPFTLLILTARQGAIEPNALGPGQRVVGVGCWRVATGLRVCTSSLLSAAASRARVLALGHIAARCLQLIRDGWQRCPSEEFSSAEFKKYIRERKDGQGSPCDFLLTSTTLLLSSLTLTMRVALLALALLPSAAFGEQCTRFVMQARFPTFF